MIHFLSTLLVLLAFQAATTPVSHLRYQRAVMAAHAGYSCAVLAPSLFAHAAPTLADLRLYTTAGTHAIPFALLVNGPLTDETEPARILNLRQTGRALSFDLAMPARPFTDVILALARPDLLARATVTSAGTSLGDFTLFDLTAQHLPADTTLHLQETATPLLHVDLVPLPGSPVITPAMLTGATVPPSREAQTLFTTAFSTSALTQTGHATVAHFTVPAHIPIERVRFVLAPGKQPNVSRPVHITSHPLSQPASSGEVMDGTLGHLRLSRTGAALSLDHLTVPATIGANLQQPADVEVAIDNGTSPPLLIAAIVLESRQRQLCFNAPAAAALTLFYGDPKLEPTQASPHLDLASATVATLGPEQSNPLYTPRADTRSLTRRHPRFFSLGGILLVCLAAVIALRTKKFRL